MKRPGDVLLRKRLTSIAGALWVVTLAIVLPRTSVSQSPTAVSAGYTLTMLSNGSWLVIGSSGKAGQTSAVIIERRTRQVQAAGALLHDRAWHTATALPDGTVLVAGGIDLAGHVLAAPEIFDPVRQSFEALPSSGLTPRAYHSATLLTDGTVLLAGGVGADGVAQRSADIWDYRTRTGWRLASEMSAPRSRPEIRLLPDGSALVSGGLAEGDQSGAKAEIYAPWHRGFQSWYSGPAARNDAIVEGSFPEDQSTGIAADTEIGLRFSRRLELDSLAGTITLSDGGQILPARIVPAERGRLVFVTPQAPLAPFMHYTLVVSGAKDEDGKAVPYTIHTFTTGGASNDVLNLTYSTVNSGLSSIHADGNPIIKAAPPAPNPANSTTIKNFMACLNNTKLGNIANTVSCIPANTCSFTVTMSTESLQPACTIAGIQFPRVILDCPGNGNLRFRPSYLLCPQGKQGTTRLSDHVELGEDATAVTFRLGDRQNTGNMFMGDVFVDPAGGYRAMSLENVAIYGKDLATAKNTCESFCHKPPVNNGMNELARFPPINPFADFHGTNNLAQFVIFTNVDPATYPGANKSPKGSDQKKAFSAICTAIANNKAKVTKADSSIPAATLDIVTNLCTNLVSKVK